MKIIADDKIPYLKGAFEQIADIEYLPGGEISSAHMKNVDALIVRTRTKCNSDLLSDSKVRFIATATIGFDHIDTDYCNNRGIVWTNAPGCNSGSVQQYIASVLVFLSNKHQFTLRGKTIGIVGVGNVGSKIAALAKVLGMNVLLNDPPRERAEGGDGFVSLDKIKKEADIITFHVPLNKEGVDKTIYLAGKNFLSELSENAIIINSSRGEVVDNLALKNALTEGVIKGAVLDVWEKEPNIDLELLKLVDIATPHIAGYSKDGKSNGTAMSVRELSTFFGLGIDEWMPQGIEEPDNDEIVIDAKGLSEEEVIKKALWQTYQISDDDKKLKGTPETFEKQRGDYPVRREFFAYKIKLENDNNNVVEKLIKLGFQVVQ